MTFPVFDLHCDTSFAMLGQDLHPNCSLLHNDLHIALDRAGELSGYAQCFACFTSDALKYPEGIDSRILFERELQVILDELHANQDLICQAFSAAQVEENRAAGRFSGILTIEGPAGFTYDPQRLDALYRLGFRITTLGWNDKNPLTGSHATGEGLTEIGRAYVREAQRLGMLIDVSHISDKAFWEIMDMTQMPVIASHSNSRTVWNVSRNLTDDMFLAICRTGGVVGINLYADFLGKHPDLNTVCDHILHFLSLDTEGKHIALGGDLDGCDVLPDGFHGVQDYTKLADALIARGLDENTVYDIFWNNAMGVMERCCI